MVSKFYDFRNNEVIKGSVIPDNISHWKEISEVVKERVAMTSQLSSGGRNFVQLGPITFHIFQNVVYC